MKWDDDLTEMLKTLWTQGLSGNQIAARLGGTMSRNAVIGKIHRLGLSGRTLTSKAVQSHVAAKRRGKQAIPPQAKTSFKRAHGAPRMIPDSMPTPADTDVARCHLLELAPDACRWPVGDPGTSRFGFCGIRQIEGASYCEDHFRRAYRGGADNDE